jgi:arginine utilization protein RocB
MDKTTAERSFSVELKSMINLKNVTMHNGCQENVLVEGTIGNLLHVVFVEGIVLEVVGDKGVLRINLTQNEIKKREKQEKDA